MGSVALRWLLLVVLLLSLLELAHVNNEYSKKMTKEKAIQIVKSMSKKDIESAAVVKHKQTSKGVKWSDNSILSQRSKHVMVSRYDAFRKYLNRNLLG